MASGLRSQQVGWWLFSSILLTSVQGALCADDYSIGGLVASAAVGFLLLAIIIGLLVVGLTWNIWYPKLQWVKGKVKMPKAYWKKKEEAKLRLLHGSRSGLGSVADSGLPNGNSSSRVRDTASWIQGWNNANHLGNVGYEEMALAMDLGDEEDVRIVTTVLDNNGTLASGRDSPQDTSTATGGGTTPVVRASTSRADGEVGEGADAIASRAAPAFTDMMEDNHQDESGGDSYIYAIVDRSKTSHVPTSTPRTHHHGDAGSDDGPAATSEKVTSFPKMEPYLVAL